MSSFDPQDSIQEPTPLRPMLSINLRERLHVPTTPRPLSQETTYTDRTSRRGSLETNPPHLAPGEQPQILTARALNLGPQVPTPPPSPPLLERPAGFKKWMAWLFVGAASTAIALLIINMALLIFLGLKDHSSTVYIKTSPLVPNGTAISVSVDPSPTPSKRRGFESAPSDKLADINISEHDTSIFTSTLIVFDNTFAVVPTSDLPTKEQESTTTIQVNVVTTTTTNVIRTETLRLTALMPAEPAATKTVTAVAAPESVPTSLSLASITVDLQFTVVNSGGVRSTKRKAVRNILCTALLAGGILVSHRGF
ncbi:hypothetical protein BKA65DRAFT_504548 [Rhexocercosporidium sp. MPI-PUGE-AT-0058]|nr:hypothetical protein BKA65DRAFT_504548 [Rhexocercosporidium sp. MPI-PUGE-AT-0058]